MNLERETPTVGGPALGRRGRSHWRTSSQLLRLRLYVTLVLLDIGCILGSFLIAHVVYPLGQSNQAELIASSILPVYLAIAFASHAYGVDVIGNAGNGLRRSLQAYLLAAVTVLLVAFSFKSAEVFSRMIFGIGSICSIITLSAARVFFDGQATRILGGNPFNLVVITDDDGPPPGAEFSLVLHSSTFDPEGHDPDMYDRLATAVKNADRVVVCCRFEQRKAWVHALQGANVQAEILAPELFALAPIDVGRFGTVPTIVVARGPLSLPDRIIKRGFDIAVAGIALVLLAPLLILVAIGIKLETRGPVLFIQTRIGRGNKKFRMLKFRSMRIETTDGPGHASTQRDDDRVTRVGRIIRETSIDELPQLLNVLSGEMSVVGPRPHALGSRAEEQLFWEIDHRYWHRHAAKPGLTGLAQIRGFRGATSQRADLVNRLQADLEYLDNWSIWRDVKIVLMTFRVLIHPNAY